MSVPINMIDPEKAKRRTAIPESLTKLAKAALIYPVRFVGPTATGGEEFSAKLYAFNVFAITLLAICGYASLLGELNSFRKGQSIRFKNATVAVVACVCYTMLVVPCAIAVFGSASRQAAWLDIERLLDRVDEALDRRGCTAADERVERCTVWLVCVQAAVSAVDYHNWVKFDPTNVSYFIVYMLLYVNLVSVAVYAQLAWCIGRRFDIINSEIEAKLERLPSTNRVEFPNRQHHNLSYLLRCSNNLTKDVKFIPIKTYQEIYWNLCYSVNILNRHYGWILLTGLLMTIIRLILIPNILITNVLNTKLHGSQNYGFTISLVGWVICHLSFLFLMVLPSSYAASRAETTAVIVCRHLNGYFVPDDIKRLELFVLQLHKHKVHFSICGIVDLQRSTITKVIGTIISYLLIFIQMQNK